MSAPSPTLPMDGLRRGRRERIWKRLRAEPLLQKAVLAIAEVHEALGLAPMGDAALWELAEDVAERTGPELHRAAKGLGRAAGLLDSIQEAWDPREGEGRDEEAKAAKTGRIARAVRTAKAEQESPW